MAAKRLPTLTTDRSPETDLAPVADHHLTPDGRRCRVYIETYGCQMNVADTELMEGILEDAGFEAVDAPDDADVILVNTCSVREHAEERVFGRLGELTRFKHANPDLLLGVTGCMAKRLREKIPARVSAVDLVVGPDSYRHLAALIREHRRRPTLDVRLDRSENYLGLDPVRRSGRTGWVTIMRGCDRFCTFCIVPYVRGREKCVPPEEVVRQVQDLAATGSHEVCLLGQTVNSYRYDGTDFADLLGAVSRVEGIKRVRFTSPHPVGFTPKVVEAMATLPEVCPYVHLPVQAGHNRTLERMRRDYTVEEYVQLVENLRGAMPDMAISSDILVGFSGETDAEFEATRQLMEAVRFDFAFTFKYSPREGTVAARKLPDDVPEEVKGARLRTVIDLQEQISAERHRACVGRTVQVLVEGPAKKTPEHVYGRAADFKPVIVAGEWPQNTLIDVRVIDATSHTLFGEAVLP